MGCDIHVNLEHRKRGTGHWSTLGFHDFSLDRNYKIFGLLAGVRDEEQPHIPPRGMPNDPALATRRNNTLFVCDEPGEDYATQAQAESWVAQGLSDWTGANKQWITHPDHHSHSWLTYAEWCAALKNVIDDAHAADWRAITAAAASYNRDGHDVRFVFWYDN